MDVVVDCELKCVGNIDELSEAYFSVVFCFVVLDGLFS